MRIAIVGAGSTGLFAARWLGEDPRHVTTVFDTGERFGRPLDEHLVADAVDRLGRLGVILRRRAQVERLAADAAGTDLWINGLPERFDLALVTTSSAEAGALLARSGLRGSAPLRQRVYFAEHGHRDANESARCALLRMAADHPGVRTCSLVAPRESPIAHAVRALTHRAAGHVDLLDLSGELWPLEVPAVYLANQQRVLDVAIRRHLGLRHLRTASGTAADLESGVSLGFVGADAAPAIAALAVNAPIVPIAAQGPRTRVVIGEPFYPETSSVDELMDDMRTILRHLAHLATRVAA